MKTVILLTMSNVFMTFAWYGHLKFKHTALYKVVLISWFIAFVEYCFQFRRIGSGIRVFRGGIKNNSGNHYLNDFQCFSPFSISKKI